MSIRTKAEIKLIREARFIAELGGKGKFVSPFPCKRGHYLRYTLTQHCVECQPFHDGPKRKRALALRIKRSIQQAESW